MIRHALLLVLLSLLPATAGGQAVHPVSLSGAVTLDHPYLAPLRRVQSFDCSRLTCTQIRSCEEACHKLLVCGHRQRDGDNDGIPCENLCSRRC